MSVFYTRMRSRRLTLGLCALALTGCTQIQMVLPLGGGDDATAAIAVADPVAAQLATDKELSEGDWSEVRRALVSAMDEPQGRSVPWINPQTGVMGTLALAAPQAGPCRLFNLTVFDKISAGQVKGEACPDMAGGWSASAYR